MLPPVSAATLATGVYNSKLPQPMRFVLFSLHWLSSSDSWHVTLFILKKSRRRPACYL
jgi:hypothetical protein